MKFIQDYNESQYLAQPTIMWIMLHNILHWVSLPFKVLYFIFNSFIILIKKRTVELKSTNQKSFSVDYAELLRNQPVWKTNLFNSYVDTINSEHDGKAHSRDSQTQLHSVYLFALSLTDLGKPYLNHNSEMGLAKSIHTTGHLASGYGYNEHGENIMNNKTPTLETLSALNLAVLTSKSEVIIDKYDQMVQSISDNSMGLLEADKPDNEITAKLWSDSKAQMKFKIKSWKANMMPRLNVTGTEALVALATLKLGRKKGRNIDSEIAYKRLTNTFGYKILAATANPENLEINIPSLYVLAKSCDPTELNFWKKIMQMHVKLSDPVSLIFLLDAFPDLIPSYRKEIDELTNEFKSIEPVNDVNYLLTYTLLKKIGQVNQTV